MPKVIRFLPKVSFDCSLENGNDYVPGMHRIL